jgi:hypothetical protein
VRRELISQAETDRKRAAELFDEIFISLFKWYENFGMIVASIPIPESDRYNQRLRQSGSF